MRNTCVYSAKCHSRWASKTQSAQGEGQASSCPKLRGSGAGSADSAKYLQWPKLTLLWRGLAVKTGPLPSNNAPRGPSLSAALVLPRTNSVPVKYGLWCDSSLSKTPCDSSVLETSGENKKGNCPCQTAASTQPSVTPSNDTVKGGPCGFW